MFPKISPIIPVRRRDLFEGAKRLYDLIKTEPTDEEIHKSHWKPPVWSEA